MQFSAKSFSDAANEAVNPAHRQLVWGVFSDYVVREHDVPSELYFHAPIDLPEGLPGGKEPYQLLINPYLRDPWSGGQALTLYSPLNMPGLFLEFAGLPEEPGLDDAPCTQNNREVTFDWIKTYGVLGLTPTGFDSLTGRIHQGGRDDTLGSFVEQARYANAVLRLYEAATAPEGPNVDFIQRGIPEDRRDGFGQDPNKARSWALGRVGEVVALCLDEYCYPTFRAQEEGPPTLVWAFNNLLGAMWIQMMWLLISTGETRRCARRGCSRIITFESGQPPAAAGLEKNTRGRYKTRADKKFCSPLCRVKNHQAKNK